MKRLREIHLYLGCLFAPVLIFFAVSGAWQVFGLNRSMKDGSYVAPRVVTSLTYVHGYQHLPGTNYDAQTPLRYFVFGAAVGLVVTTGLGIVMAYRFGRSKAATIACLSAGIVIPVAILLIYR